MVVVFLVAAGFFALEDDVVVDFAAGAFVFVEGVFATGFALAAGFRSAFTAFGAGAGFASATGVASGVGRGASC